MRRTLIALALVALVALAPPVSAEPVGGEEDPVKEAIELANRLVSGSCYDGSIQQEQPDPTDLDVFPHVDPEAGTVTLVLRVPGATVVVHVRADCVLADG